MPTRDPKATPRTTFSRGALAALLLASACGRCGPGGTGAGPERFIASDAPVVAIVPELARAAREAALLHHAALAFPGTAEVAGWRDAVAAQLGLDPLDPDALRANGVDPDGAAAVAWLLPGPGAFDRDGTQLLVLPVGDAGRLEALLTRLAKERLGAAVREEDEAGRRVVTFRAAPGAPAALSYTLAEGAALVVPGAGGPEAVAAAAARRHENSLAGSAAWDRARRALGDDRALVLWVPPESLALPAGGPLRDGVAAGVTAGDRRVRVVLAALVGDREPRVRALDGPSARGAELAKRLDPRAAIAVRVDADPGALGRLALPWLPARERARFEALGLDLQRDLFDAALPGAAGAIRLNPALRVPGLDERAFRADPLRAIRFEAVARLRDPAAAAATSARLAGGGPPWRVASPAGEFAWRIDGDRLALVGGEPGDLDRLVARLDGRGDGYRPRSDGAAAALEGGLGGLAVDPANLVAQARALPLGAFGTGPGGFVMRSMMERVLEPASRLTSVSARADLADGALRVSLELEAPPPSQRPREARSAEDRP